MNSYEATRAAQIAKNKALLASLGLSKPKVEHHKRAHSSIKESGSDYEDEEQPRKKPAQKKRVGRLPQEPTRRSSRQVAAASSVKSEFQSLPDNFSDSELASSSRRRDAVLQRIRQLPAPDFPEPEEEDPDYDPDYRAPLPSRDPGYGGYGKLRFEDAPHFTPNMLPEEIMRLGSFGGTYFRPFWSSVCRQMMPADFDEFPSEWYEGLDTDRYLSSENYDPELNRYGVKASQSIEEWEKAGWIRRQDPRGWMQWYCRFYLGRRTGDDDRQIRRYLAAVGPRGRFKTSLVKKIVSAGGADAWDDGDIAPILRQTLQHWAVKITREDVEEYLMPG